MPAVSGFLFCFNVCHEGCLLVVFGICFWIRVSFISSGVLILLFLFVFGLFWLVSFYFISVSIHFVYIPLRCYVSFSAYDFVFDGNKPRISIMSQNFMMLYPSRRLPVFLGRRCRAKHSTVFVFPSRCIPQGTPHHHPRCSHNLDCVCLTASYPAAICLRSHIETQKVELETANTSG